MLGLMDQAHYRRGKGHDEDEQRPAVVRSGHCKKSKVASPSKSLDLRKWARQVLTWRPIGFRSVGRPAQRWAKEDSDDPDKED